MMFMYIKYQCFQDESILRKSIIFDFIFMHFGPTYILTYLLILRCKIFVDF